MRLGQSNGPTFCLVYHYLAVLMNAYSTMIIKSSHFEPYIMENFPICYATLVIVLLLYVSRLPS